jgi:RNA polymerase sigma-70 factor, ECF subfamily
MTPDELARFHEGHRQSMAECYLDHFATVDQAVGRYLQGADRETVIHEVFYRLLSRRELREQFQGGSLGAWLFEVAKNHAIDFLRRHQRETIVSPEEAVRLAEGPGRGFADEAEARLLLEVFQRDHLPPKWHRVFEARFLRGLGQAEAARALGLSRTTLAYQELRVRRLLEKFLLGSQGR